MFFQTINFPKRLYQGKCLLAYMGKAMFRTLKAITFFAIATIAVAPVEATVTIYNVSGTFQNGAALSGSFEVDGNITDWFDRFINVSLSIVDSGNFNTVSGIGYSPTSYDVDFSGSNGSILYLFIPAINNEGKLLGLDGNSLSNNTFYYDPSISKSGISLVSGTIISSASTASVPEPATWAMMIAGFGVVGLAMRRRIKIEQTMQLA